MCWIVIDPPPSFSSLAALRSLCHTGGVRLVISCLERRANSLTTDMLSVAIMRCVRCGTSSNAASTASTSGVNDEGGPRTAKAVERGEPGPAYVEAPMRLLSGQYAPSVVQRRQRLPLKVTYLCAEHLKFLGLALR